MVYSPERNKKPAVATTDELYSLYSSCCSIGL